MRPCRVALKTCEHLNSSISSFSRSFDEGFQFPEIFVLQSRDLSMVLDPFQIPTPVYSLVRAVETFFPLVCVGRCEEALAALEGSENERPSLGGIYRRSWNTA